MLDTNSKEEESVLDSKTSRALKCLEDIFRGDSYKLRAWEETFVEAETFFFRASCFLSSRLVMHQNTRVHVWHR